MALNYREEPLLTLLQIIQNNFFTCGESQTQEYKVVAKRKMSSEYPLDFTQVSKVQEMKQKKKNLLQNFK